MDMDNDALYCTALHCTAAHSTAPHRRIGSTPLCLWVNRSLSSPSHEALSHCTSLSVSPALCASPSAQFEYGCIPAQNRREATHLARVPTNPPAGGQSHPLAVVSLHRPLHHLHPRFPSPSPSPSPNPASGDAAPPHEHRQLSRHHPKPRGAAAEPIY